jgi:hypothetical protein
VSVRLPFAALAIATGVGLAWLAGDAAPPRTGSGDGGPIVHRVASGRDLDHALRASEPGDTILLVPGVTYRGPFTLPAKRGAGWIEIRTSARDLPPPGVRVTPDDAPRLARLVAATGPVVATADGAQHWRLVGLEIAPVAGAFLDDVVRLAPASRGGEVPHHIAIERCWIHGDARRGSRRGIALNSAHTTVSDSWLSELKGVGVETQAIAGWAGPGPFRIENNHLEAAGVNVLFGGADPAERGLVPSNIEILRNDLVKREAWRDGGEGWTVKNLLELKNARRVTIDGNLLAHTWPAAQAGFAVLFTVRNQDGGAPWSVVEDVRFTNNVVRDAAGGINFLGHDDAAPSGRTRGIVVRNNVFEDIDGRLFQLLDGTADVTIEHNVAFARGPVVMAEGRPHTGFVLRDNVIVAEDPSLAGTDARPGRPVLDRYFPGATVLGNVLVGRGDARLQAAGNSFLDTAATLRLERELPYALCADSPYARSSSAGDAPGVRLREFHEARRR